MRTLLSLVAAVAAAIALTAYLCAFAYLYLTQQRLVFPGKAPDSALESELLCRTPSLRDLTISAPDAGTLAGRLLERPAPPARAEKAPLMLYFGGNADLVDQFFLDASEQLPGVSIAAVDYRGYGKSAGIPSEAALKADALLVYDQLRKTSQAAQNGLIVMGRSLGTALAAHVAANREVAAVILVTPFDSIRAVGQERYPLIPVGLLLTSPFDVLADAAKAHAPALILIAGLDRTTPPEHGRRLAAAWGGPKIILTLAAGHDGILAQPDYWPAIRDFVRRSAAASSALSPGK